MHGVALPFGGMTEKTAGTFSFAEAAKLLGVSLGQAYRLEHAGMFPVPIIRLGTVRKVRVAELEDYLRGSVPVAPTGAEAVVRDGAALAAIARHVGQALIRAADEIESTHSGTARRLSAL